MRSAKAVVSERGYAGHGADATMSSQQPQYTVTSMKRWSIANKELPPVSQVRSIHVYDFDNTLFLSPLPNPQLWHASTIGQLQACESFANGGWWHDPNILSATGKGLEQEEPLGWQGWWNENILQLVRLSMQQKDVVTVLLTGRGEDAFANLIKRMVASQQLEFDLIGLKPEVGPNGQRFPSTMTFKQNFFSDLVLTYDQAEEIKVYEDRPKHVKAFRDFFEQMNIHFQSSQVPPNRKPINTEVIQVFEGATCLDPVTETAEVQRMINSHNLACRNPSLGRNRLSSGPMRIRKTVIYTGYLISQSDSARLVEEILNPVLPTGLAESNDLKYLANNILIAPRPAPMSILEKAGGMGNAVTWQITGTAIHENRVFAARVEPVPRTQKIYSENSVPLIVLAVRKGARPNEASKINNWQPVPPNMALTFDSVVGEKVILQIEAEQKPKNWRNTNYTNKKRPHEADEGTSRSRGYDGPGYEPQAPGYHPYQRPSGGQAEESSRRGGSNRGRGRGNGRGRASRGGRGGRGRGGFGNPHYRSLDDASNFEVPIDPRNGNPGGGPMDY